MENRDIAKRFQEAERTIRPHCNVTEQKGSMYLALGMPGVSKSNLEIQVDGNQLKVFGRRESEAVEGTYVVRERRQGNYFCEYTLDDTVDTGKVDASLEGGLVTITLPMKEAAKPRKVQIRAT